MCRGFTYRSSQNGRVKPFCHVSAACGDGRENAAKVTTGNTLDPRGAGLPEETAKPCIEALEGCPSSEGTSGERQGDAGEGLS